jgi:hypothetical protein
MEIKLIKKFVTRVNELKKKIMDIFLQARK